MGNLEELLIDIMKGLRAQKLRDNLWDLSDTIPYENQEQTTEAFSEKWGKTYRGHDSTALESFYNFQKKWFLKLYGFSSEEELRDFLKGKKYIFDAGCGIGYKTRWFSELAPEAIVIGMDLSDAILAAAELQEDKENIIFIKGDIMDTKFKEEIFRFYKLRSSPSSCGISRQSSQRTCKNIKKGRGNHSICICEESTS